jgi:Zn-finger nucleic acid-binding protein
METLTCPSCGDSLKPKETAGVRAHVCEGGCGGLWFELQQVRRLKDRLPGSGQEFLFIERSEGVHLWRNPEHPCPVCRTTLLYRHCFSRKQEVEIDQCSKCGGYWVEPGRLAALGNDAKSPEEKTELARDFFEDLFDRRVRGMNMVNHDTLESAQQIVRVFHFITPAEFLPATPPLELD